jgi:hypothetical protein
VSQRVLTGGMKVIRRSSEGGEIVITYSFDGLRAAAVEAFAEANEWLDDRAKREANLVKWPWPNDPSPRDVRDVGRLISSITAEVEPTATEPGSQWLHTVDVDYAAPVLLGYRQGSRTYPARNIYEAALDHGGFDATFIDAYRRALSRLRPPEGDA